MGYEDINDHETLRHDPIFALAVGKVINSEQELITLAGKSTLNRLEHCPENISSRADSRYHRIEHDAESIETLLVELFLESYRKPPQQIILDLDVTEWQGCDELWGGMDASRYKDELNRLPLAINCQISCSCSLEDLFK